MSCSLASSGGSRSSPEGREAVLNVVHEGEVFGEIALFDGRPRTAAAIAITDCELMSIDRRHFLPLVRQQPDVAIKLIEILCARLRRSSEQYEDIMFLNLRARVAKVLLRLAEEAGTSAPQKEKSSPSTRALDPCVQAQRSQQVFSRAVRDRPSF